MTTLSIRLSALVKRLQYRPSFHAVILGMTVGWARKYSMPAYQPVWLRSYSSMRANRP